MIDARYLAQPPSGIPRYTRNLLEAIRVADPTRAVRVLIHDTTVLPEKMTHHSSFDWVVDRNTPRSPGEILRWRGRLRHMNPAVVHCPDAFAPLWAGPQVMLTLHDAIPLMPELTGPGVRSKKERFRRAWRTWLRMQCRRANAVLTVSRHSANDLRRLLDLDPRKLHVVPNTVPSPEKFQSSPTNAITLPDSPYLLCVGRFDPYKNAVGLVEAFAKLPSNLHLIFVGPLDARFPEAPVRAEQLGIRNRVSFTGAVDDANLHRLYANAAVLVMPSRYEGFGLPAIEAMHHGVPVVASNTGALLEIVGDAALTVDTTQPAELANAIGNLLENSALQSRLAVLGHARAADFSLAEVGAKYLEVIDRVVALTPASSGSTMVT